MAWSRTYLQVHWLLDVTAGSILGVGVALGVQVERLDSPGAPAISQRVTRGARRASERAVLIAGGFIRGIALLRPARMVREGGALHGEEPTGLCQSL